MLRQLKSRVVEALRIVWMVVTKTPDQMLEEKRRLRRELKDIEHDIGLSVSSLPTDALKSFQKGLEGMAERLGEEENGQS